MLHLQRSSSMGTTPATFNHSFPYRNSNSQQSCSTPVKTLLKPVSRHGSTYEPPKQSSFLDDVNLLKSRVFRVRFDRAATTIQRIIRGRQLRRKLPVLIESIVMGKAAVKIQASFRGFLSRYRGAIQLLAGQLELVERIKRLEIDAIKRQQCEAQLQFKAEHELKRKTKSSVKANDVVSLLQVENDRSREEYAEIQNLCSSLLQDNNDLEKKFLDINGQVAFLETDICEMEQENKQWESYMLAFQKQADEFSDAIREMVNLAAEEAAMKNRLRGRIARIEKRVSGSSTGGNGFQTLLSTWGETVTMPKIGSTC